MLYLISYIIIVETSILNDQSVFFLGAAMFAFAGVGIFNSPNEARQNVAYQWELVYPQQKQ